MILAQIITFSFVETADKSLKSEADQGPLMWATITKCQLSKRRSEKWESSRCFVVCSSIKIQDLK